MAYKLHCDICDAVLPETQDYVYLVTKEDYRSRDWRHGDDPAVGCYPCLGALLPQLPEKVREQA